MIRSGTMIMVAAVTCLSLAWRAPARGVPCPGTVQVRLSVVNNNTSSSPLTVNLTGTSRSVTCTTGSGSYSTSVSLPVCGTPPCAAQQTTVSGLDTGIWTHRVSYTVGTETVTQYQKGFVVYDPSGTAPKIVNWTQYPKAITVNTAGDASSCTSTCPDCPINAPPGACNIRCALCTVNAGGTGTDPLLILVSASPGTLSDGLSITRSNVTLDGSDAYGEPWIVADANLAATLSGGQRAIPRAVQFPVATGLSIGNSNIQIIGLELSEVVSPSVAAVPVIDQALDQFGVQIVRSRIDGGMTQDCSVYPNSCSWPYDALRVNGLLFNNPGTDVVTLDDVEVRSAIDKGVQLGTDQSGGLYGGQVQAKIKNSWLHNNYKGNLSATDASLVSVNSSVIERAGLRVTDDKQMNSAPGVVFIHPGFAYNPPATSYWQSQKTIVRHNATHGLEATSSAAYVQPNYDALCGNEQDGLYTAAGGTPSGSPHVLGQGGLVAAYNGNTGSAANTKHGASMNVTTPYPTPGYDKVGNYSAFVSNSECGLYNKTATTLFAQQNQWQGSAPYLDDCHANTPPGGPVDTSNAVDPRDPTNLIQSIDVPTPSDAMYAEQTIRVTGLYFTGIGGNPSASSAGCTVGVDGSGSWNGQGAPQAGSCCKAARGNTCDPNHNPPPLTPGPSGHCVEAKDHSTPPIYSAMTVRSVTPRMIEAQLPSYSSQFGCLGGSNEAVRVSARDRNGFVKRTEGNYCTPYNP